MSGAGATEDVDVPPQTPEDPSSVASAAAAASAASISHWRQDETEAQELLERLSDDLLGCDAQLNLFESSVTSYRFDSVCSPFPPDYFQSAPVSSCLLYTSDAADE